MKELFTSARTAYKTKIIELGHVIFHDSSPVAKFCAPIFVVARADGDQGPVVDPTETDNTERSRKSLVGAPVTRQ